MHDSSSGVHHTSNRPFRHFASALLHYFAAARFAQRNKNPRTLSRTGIVGLRNGSRMHSAAAARHYAAASFSFFSA
ncbi:TPA: hypothetical protein ACK3SM_007662, partial [Burkholderia cepacia]